MTAVDHLGASLPVGPPASTSKHQIGQSQSETSSGSVKQEQKPQVLEQPEGQDLPTDTVVSADLAAAPIITAAEAAKTRQTRARKPVTVQSIAAGDPEPPPRRRTTVLKERQRERAQSEQTDEDFVVGSSRAKPKRKGTDAGTGNKKQAAAGSASNRIKAAKATLTPAMEESPEPPEEMDILLGCTKCRYLKGGCGACRDKPALERPKTLRWKPDASKQQKVPVCLLQPDDKHCKNHA